MRDTARSVNTASAYMYCHDRHHHHYDHHYRIAVFLYAEMLTFEVVFV